MDPRPPAAFWIDGDQVSLAREVARLAGLSVVAAGAAGAGTLIAESLQAVRPISDLRAALADAGAGLDVRCVVILARASLGDTELAALTSAVSRRVVVASIEPVPSHLDELTAGAWLARGPGSRPIDAARGLARLRRGPAMRHARDMLDSFGPIRCAWVRVEAPPLAGSLGARLVDGLGLLHNLLGAAETVHAAGVGLDHARPAPSLAALDGDLCVTLTHADTRIGCVQASNRAPRWQREVELIGDGGQVRLDDRSFTWIGPDGSLRDEWRAGKADASPVPGEVAPDLFSIADHDPAAEAIAESIRRLLDPHVAPEPPGEPEGVLAAAHAALLSARTRNSESPATIRRMLARE